MKKKYHFHNGVLVEDSPKGEPRYLVKSGWKFIEYKGFIVPQRIQEPAIGVAIRSLDNDEYATVKTGNIIKVYDAKRDRRIKILS